MAKRRGKRKTAPAAVATEPKKSKKEVESEPEVEEVEEERLPMVSTEHGIVLTFGSGDMGQLGLGENMKYRQRKKAFVMPAPFNPTDDDDEKKVDKAVYVTAGSLHNAVLTEGGAVYTWGCNDDGCLGRLNVEDEFVPGLVPHWDSGIVKVEAGACHTLALSARGFVYSCGLYRNIYGVMGFTGKIKKQSTPVVVEALVGKKCVDIAAADHHDLALTDKGHIYQWGDVWVGTRASRRTRTKLNAQRVKMPKGAGRPTKIFAGGATSFAVCEDGGALYGWGPNNYGQLGIDNSATRGKEENQFVYKPTRIGEKEFKGLKVVKVSCSLHHSLFLMSDGSVYAAGRGQYGYLGLGEDKTEDVCIPTKIAALKAEKVVDISCGEAHSMCATQSGKLFTWGAGDCLQLGTGDEDCLKTPHYVQSRNLTDIARKVLAVSAGSQHSCVVALTL